MPCYGKVLLFSNKSKAPALFRSLSNDFASLTFAFVKDSYKPILKKFDVKKVRPAISLWAPLSNLEP